MCVIDYPSFSCRYITAQISGFWRAMGVTGHRESAKSSVHCAATTVSGVQCIPALSSAPLPAAAQHSASASASGRDDTMEGSGQLSAGARHDAGP